MRLTSDTYTQYLPVSYTSSNVSPRYDIPKAAPEPLRQVQLLINSIDLTHQRDWLPGWLEEHGLVPERKRAEDLREALRALVLANNGVELEPGPLEVLNQAAARLSLRLDAEAHLHVSADGDALDEVTAIALGAMLDGSWSRLKACRNCRWSF